MCCAISITPDSGPIILTSSPGWKSKFENDVELFVSPSGDEFIRAAEHEPATYLYTPKTRGLPPLRLKPKDAPSVPRKTEPPTLRLLPRTESQPGDKRWCCPNCRHVISMGARGSTARQGKWEPVPPSCSTCLTPLVSVPRGARLRPPEPEDSEWIVVACGGDGGPGCARGFEVASALTKLPGCPS